MAVTEAIPLPRVGLLGSTEMIDSLMKNKLTPYQLQLLKAQTDEASAKAVKSNMLAELIKRAMNGSATSAGGAPNLLPGSTASTSPAGSSQPSTMNNAGPLASALLGLHVGSGVNEGKFYTYDPISGYQSQKIGESPSEKRLGEAQSKATGKVLEDVGEDVKSGLDVKDSLSGLRELISNPRFKNIAGTVEGSVMSAKPFGIPVGQALQHLYPKEDQELFGKVNTYMGNLVKDFGKQFKGTFSSRIQGLVQTYKPNVGDSEQIQNGKLKALETLNQIGLKRSALVDQYIAKGMSPTAAMLKADKMVPYSMIEKEVEAAAKSAMESGQVNSEPPNTVNTAPVNPEDQLQKWANEAIAQGADPAAVNAEMQRLKTGK